MKSFGYDDLKNFLIEVCEEYSLGSSGTFNEETFDCFNVIGGRSMDIEFYRRDMKWHVELKGVRGIDYDQTTDEYDNLWCEIDGDNERFVIHLINIKNPLTAGGVKYYRREDDRLVIPMGMLTWL